MRSTELTRVAPSIPGGTEIGELTRLGNLLGQSGFFKDVRSGHQAFTKLLFGRDLGLSATASMTGVHIIEGKPEISANVQAQMVNTYIGPDGERYRYRVREHDNQHCKIEFFQRERDKEWESLGFSEYTMDDAAIAQLAGRGTWKKHPRNMLFARAMSDGVAFYCPEVTNGIRVYHDYEIDVDGNGRDEAPAPAGSFRAAPVNGAVSDDEVVDGEVVDEPSEPERPARAVKLPKRTLDSLTAAREEAGVSDQWLRMQLVALGAEDVPEDVTRDVLAKLTAEQADSLQSALNAAVDAREAGGDGNR